MSTITTMKWKNWKTMMDKIISIKNFKLLKQPYYNNNSNYNTSIAQVPMCQTLKC